MAKQAKTSAGKSDVDDLFSDTRGAKTSRKRVDGLPVYTYDELRVSATSGGAGCIHLLCMLCQLTWHAWQGRSYARLIASAAFNLD